MLNIESSFKPKGVKNNKETELAVFYTNDMHGDLNRLSKFKSAHDEFKKENSHVPNLTLAAGDCLFGTDKKRVGLMVKLFNILKLDGLALGNHEFAGGSSALAENLKPAKFKSISANLEIPEKNSLKSLLQSKKLVKSAVFMKGGEKFAVIGASPIDSYIGVGEPEKTKVNPMDLKKTINVINEEAKKFEAQGINKILLCSHLGYENDLEVAKKTDGIDIIVGGHTHTTIEGVNSEHKSGNNKLNLLTSRRNEPVMITQAGAMNENVGYLNVIFDEKGVINPANITNKLINIADCKDSEQVNNLIKKTLGENINLAEVKFPHQYKNSWHERYMENPLHNAVADGMLQAGKKLGVKCALFNAAAVRGGMDKNITSYEVKYSMIPFNDDVKVIDITEKDFISLLNSVTTPLYRDNNNDPQVLRPAGLTYSASKKAKENSNGDLIYIKDVKLDSGETINTENPSDTKTIKIALNKYLFNLDLTKSVLEKYSGNTKEIGNMQDIFKDYLIQAKEIKNSLNDEARIKFL